MWLLISLVLNFTVYLATPVDRGKIIQIYRGYSLKEMSVSQSIDSEHLKVGNRPGRVSKETIIFYTTRHIQAEAHKDMNMELLESGLPECVNYCPRCKMLMQRIEFLFPRSPPTNRPKDLRELFSCPPCTDIVHKFKKFIDTKSIVASTAGSPKDLGTMKREDGKDKDVRKLKKDAGAAGTTKDVSETKREGKKDKEGLSKDTISIVASTAGTSKDLGRMKREDRKDKDVRKLKKEAGAAGTTKDVIETKREGKKDKEGLSKDTKSIVASTAGPSKDLGRMKREDGKDKDVRKLKKEAGAAGTMKDVSETKREGKKDKEGLSKDSKSIVASTAGSSKDLGRMKREHGKDKDVRKLKKKAGAAGTTKDVSETKRTSKIKKDDEIITDGNDRKSQNKGKGTKASASQTWKKLPKEEQERVSSYNTESVSIREAIIKYMSERKKLYERHIKEATATRLARAVAEAARQEKFKEKLLHTTVAPPTPYVESSIVTDECPRDQEVTAFIKGNRIYKMKKELPHQDRPEDPATARRVKFTRPPTPGPAADQISSVGSISYGRSRTGRTDGVLYKLSDRKYVHKGWTQLPKEIVVRKMAVFQMRPTRVPFDWFEKNKSKSRLFYQSGQELATFDENGTRFYYLSGQLAMEYYNAKDPSAGGKQVIVYSTGRQEGRACPRTVLAVFDYVGNGVVYNHAGHTRLKYNQSEGVVFDPTIRPHTQWKWHNLNIPPVLYTVLLEEEPQIKDPITLEHGMEDDKPKSISMWNENIMKDIEAQNIVKENKTPVDKYVTFLVEMKTFKINEHFSLRIRKQSQIYLNFSDGRSTLKINVGLILDHNVVVNEEFVEVGVVKNFENIPECSESVERLGVMERRARSAERSRVLRERKQNHAPHIREAPKKLDAQTSPK